MQHTDRDWFETCLVDDELVDALKRIKLIISDIDGCQTDNTIYLHEDNEPVRGFSVQDGYGTLHAIRAGLHIAFLSGKASAPSRIRAQKLGIPDALYREGVDSNKDAAARALIETARVTKEETLYFGDDVLDLACKDACALFVAPHNAPFYVQHAARLVVPKSGGAGAFRLLLDLVLFVQGKHFAQAHINEALD